MSGHSKWSSIKHQKAAADAKRGAAFTKLANAISLAAKQGGADPEMNFKLRLAIDRARAANMPMANIDRAVKRGSGQLAGEQVEEILYEGLGPGGVAVMIEAATDNRNRANSDIRTALTKAGGRMADSGSVAYQFERKGVIVIVASDQDAASLDAIEAGADDIETDEPGKLTVYTAPTKLDEVRRALAGQGYAVESAELSYVPNSTVEVTDPKIAAQLMKMMNALEDLDDVAATYSNFDIPEELMEQVA